MDILKVLIICLIAAVLSSLFKQKSSEYTLLISIATATILLIFIIKNIMVPIATIEQKIESYGIKSDYFKVALKALGIGYITTFIADTCRDAGQANLAIKAELAGKCAIFILSVPLMLYVLDTALGFIK